MPMWILAANPTAIIIFFIAVFLSFAVGFVIGNTSTLATFSTALTETTVIVDNPNRHVLVFVFACRNGVARFNLCPVLASRRQRCAVFRQTKR